MSDPDTNTPNQSTAGSDPIGGESGAEVIAQLRGFADETTALVAAIGRLASAEASLSLTALSRTVGFRMAGVILLVFAALFFAIAGTLALAAWLGSMAAALACVGAALSLIAATLLWRATIWRKRIGFAETRAALSVDSPPASDVRS